MLRGSRSTVVAATSLVVLSGVLTACGSSTPGTGLDFGDGLDAVTVDGEIGAATIDFKTRMTADEVTEETLIEGEGDALKKDETAYINFVIGNGYTREIAVDTFGGEAEAATTLTIGAPENEAPVDIGQVLGNVFRDYIKEGVTKGTRIAITGDTLELFPQAEIGSQLSGLLATNGIGNEDGLVVVADVMDVDVLAGPEGKRNGIPGWAPRPLGNAAGLTGLDFTGKPKPKAKADLLFTEVLTGTGEKVEKGDLLVADYLGQINGAKKPFDSSFTKDREPTPFPIGTGGVIPGWDEVLVGKTVGSRIIMRIPPAKGYADQEQPGIPANSTLYFVVDILAAV